MHYFFEENVHLHRLHSANLSLVLLGPVLEALPKEDNRRFRRQRILDQRPFSNCDRSLDFDQFTALQTARIFLQIGVALLQDQFEFVIHPEAEQAAVDQHMRGDCDRPHCIVRRERGHFPAWRHHVRSELHADLEDGLIGRDEFHAADAPVEEV